MKHTKVFFCAVAILALVCLPSLVHALTHTKTTESERKVSLTVRRLMWDSYFNNDQGQLKRLIGEDFLTINPGEEHLQDKAEFLAGAQSFLKHQGKLVSLIVPKTEIQEFGGVAVLYSTVRITMESGGKRGLQQQLCSRNAAIYGFYSEHSTNRITPSRDISTSSALT